MPDKLSLKRPRKNFGFIPEFSLLFWAALFVFLFVIPFVNFVMQYINGFVIPPHEYYWAGVQTVILLACGIFMLYGGKTLWRYSLRKRYVKRHLIPFVNRKYKLKIAKVRTADFLVANEMTIDIKGTKVVFMGWECIEEEAKARSGEDLSSKVFLMLVDPTHEKLVEFPYEGAEHLVSLTPVKQVSIEESERKTRMSIRDIVDQLPVGTANIQIVPNANTEMPDVVKTIDIITTPHGTVQYSNAEMKELIDAIFFNVRMNSRSFIVVSVNPPNSDTYYLVGMLITEDGALPASAEETKLTFAKPLPRMKFLDEISEFKNLGQR